MTWQVLWEPAALNSAAGHLKGDPNSVDTLLRAADRLAQDERPEGSHAWGAEHRRSHRAPWRILCRIDPQTRTLHIEHVGRTAA
ncbi:type II toxin-antitoxin system RelE/ParE family toxin [Streptomyces adelaidensis]|uniref:type II toxin-antitoxin system RelE/ParE family toxin n=1 Tax=Streptomyces adelaidensis TaxID=2796465 RepID=UPI001905DBD2|nr:type II toxin-antitoxin system RelE/ParE family toxin [Streptomyces adelaidensis]